MKNDPLSDLCNQVNKIAAKRRSERRAARWESFKEWLGIGAMCGGIGGIVLLGCLGLLVLLILGPALLATLIYFGWNLAIVPIFGMPAITFLWQSVGLAFLVMVASAIFKGIINVTTKG